MIANELPMNQGLVPVGGHLRSNEQTHVIPTGVANYLEATPMMFKGQAVKYVAGNTQVASNNLSHEQGVIDASFPTGGAFMVGFSDNGQQRGIITNVDFGPRLDELQVNQLTAAFQTEVLAFLTQTRQYARGGSFAAWDFINRVVARVHGDISLQENFRIGQLMQLGSIRHALKTGFMTTGFLKTHQQMPDLPIGEKIDDHLRIASAYGRFARLVGAFSVFKEEAIPLEEGVSVVGEILSHETTNNQFYLKDDVSDIEVSPELMIHAFELMVNAEKHARNNHGLRDLNVTMQAGLTQNHLGECVQLVVYDNVAVGLDYEVAQEMFTKGKSTSGTLGLGLFEAHREITAMGGRILAVDLNEGIQFVPSRNGADFGVALPEVADERLLTDLSLSLANSTAFVIEIPLERGVEVEP